jgi:osmoprotectant transport system permease protein
MLSEMFLYYREHVGEYWNAVATHMSIGIIVVLTAILIGIPLGLICAKYPRTSKFISGTVNIMRIIPSLAIMIIMIPLLGIGKVPAVIALMIIAIPPVMINTAAGFLSIEPNLYETATGMGMNKQQIFWKVEAPLALPLIITGIRTSIVETIASTTIATYIGAGGLGNLVFTGLGMNRTDILLVGGLSIAFLSIVVDILLAGVQTAIGRLLGREE